MPIHPCMAGVCLRACPVNILLIKENCPQEQCLSMEHVAVTETVLFSGRGRRMSAEGRERNSSGLWYYVNVANGSFRVKRKVGNQRICEALGTAFLTSLRSSSGGGLEPEHAAAFPGWFSAGAARLVLGGTLDTPCPLGSGSRGFARSRGMPSSNVVPTMWCIFCLGLHGCPCAGHCSPVPRALVHCWGLC